MGCCAPLGAIVCWDEKLDRALELGQRAAGASGPARDSLSLTARVELCIYNEVFDLQTWKVVGQIAIFMGETGLWERWGDAC